MRIVWNQLNARLLKWVKWEKDLYKMASVRYLKTKYKERPNLFAHWLLVSLNNFIFKCFINMKSSRKSGQAV